MKGDTTQHLTAASINALQEAGANDRREPKLAAHAQEGPDLANGFYVGYRQDRFRTRRVRLVTPQDSLRNFIAPAVNFDPRGR